MFLTNDGKLYGCGHGSYGQLGLKKTGNVVVPTLVKNMINKFVVKLACGWNHTLVVVSPSYCYATGLAKYGQLGLRDLDTRKEFTYIESLRNRNISKIFAGGQHSWFLVDSEHPEISDYEIPSPLAESPRTSVDRIQSRQLVSRGSRREQQTSYDNLTDKKGGSFIKSRNRKDLSILSHRSKTMDCQIDDDRSNVLPWSQPQGFKEEIPALDSYYNNLKNYDTDDEPNSDHINLINDIEERMDKDKSANSDANKSAEQYNNGIQHKTVKTSKETFTQLIQQKNETSSKIQCDEFSENVHPDYNEVSNKIKAKRDRTPEKELEPYLTSQPSDINNSIYTPKAKRSLLPQKQTLEKEPACREEDDHGNQVSEENTAKDVEPKLLLREPEPFHKIFTRNLMSKKLPSHKFNLTFTDLLASHKFILISCASHDVETVKGKALGVIEKLQDVDPLILCSEVVKHEPYYEKTRNSFIKLDNQKDGVETVTAMIIQQKENLTADLLSYPKSSYKNVEIVDTFMGPMYHMQTTDFKRDKRWALLGLWALAFIDEFQDSAIELKFIEMRPVALK